MRFIGFYDYTVWLTYISLASALVGMLQASRGNLGWAVFCIMFSGFCDMFDSVLLSSPPTFFAGSSALRYLTCLKQAVRLTPTRVHA